jgi:hypothetical protein
MAFDILTVCHTAGHRLFFVFVYIKIPDNILNIFLQSDQPYSNVNQINKGQSDGPRTSFAQ